MIVTVFLLGSGGAADAAPGPSYLFGPCPGAGAGAGTTTGIWAFAGAEATIIGSPPSGSLTTTAHPANVATNRPSNPAITWGMAIGIRKRLRFFASWPSGASRSSVATAEIPANHGGTLEGRSLTLRLP